jgi:hypothetical protein
MDFWSGGVDGKLQIENGITLLTTCISYTSLYRLTQIKGCDLLRVNWCDLDAPK